MVQGEVGIWLGLVQSGTEGSRNMVRFGSRGVQGEKGMGSRCLFHLLNLCIILMRL